MIEAVLFDLGDTLAHFTTPDLGDVLRRASRSAHQQLIAQGHSMPGFEAYFRAIKRRIGLARLWSRIIRREVQLPQILQRCHRRFGVKLEDGHVVDLALRCISPVVCRYLVLDRDANEVIAALHAAGLKLGLVSNTILPGFTIDDYLRQQGLIDYLPVRIYSSDVRHMKPQRTIFDIALKDLGVTAEKTLFIGDRSDKDVAGASRVGMRTALLVHDGRPPRGRVRPDHVIRRLSEVESILQTQRSPTGDCR
jgi:putative hydrolase of the HAD superfamily